MKKGYWLILIFLIWCAASAFWYMFGVKGISNDPVHFTPQPPLQAIIEILFMLTGAFIIGFCLAWLMREVPYNMLRHTLRTTESVVITQKTEMTSTRTEAEVWQKKWEQAEEKFGQAVQENESRLRQYEDSVKHAETQQKELRDLELKAAKLDGEVSSTHFRIRLLENDVSEKDLTIKKMAAELEELHRIPHVEHRDWSDHPFVRPVEVDPNEKDDLTMIKGIGPAFQRKLNSLDIFTFRQISELSGEGVARLAEVIEVFPDRIHRDNWIGQATKLYAKKLEA